MTEPTSPLPTDAVNAFQASLQGDVIRPGDATYETARQVWNALIDRHPALIVRPANADEVAAAVKFARAHRLRVAVRGGAHGVAGHAVCDGGLVIDMSKLKAISVDEAERTATLQGGVLGRELGQATTPHGLALPLGQVPATGVTGVLLGGGLGWLTRPYGLSSDHLLSAEVVDAEGEFLIASETSNTDLFWALRGGGGGNFGIVTEMTVRLAPVSMVLGGFAFYPIEQTADVLRFYRDFAASAPDLLTVSAMFMPLPPAPGIPAEFQGKPSVSINICYVGALPDGEKAIVPLRAFGKPLAAQFGPMPFSVLQSMGEPGAALGLQRDVRGMYLAGLSDQAIDVIAEYTARMPPPITQVQIMHLGGAMARVAPDATAFAYRNYPYLLVLLPGWQGAEAAPAHRAWADGFQKAMASESAAGAYVNFMNNDSPDGVRAAYGANYERLVAIKQKYDPTNFFRNNFNIAP